MGLLSDDVIPPLDVEKSVERLIKLTIAHRAMLLHHCKRSETAGRTGKFTNLALKMVASAMKQPSATRGDPVKHLSTVQSSSGPMSGLQSSSRTMVSRANSYI